MLLNHRYTTGYTVTPNALLVSPSVTLEVKGMYTYLSSKPPQWEFSAERISKEMKESLSTINRIMKLVEEAGLLKRRKMKKDGKWSGVAYTLTDLSNIKIVVEYKESKPRNIKSYDLPLEERRMIFKKTVVAMYETKKERMSVELAKRFYEYWSEETQDGKEMRYELNITWNLSQRMEKFIKNEIKYNQKMEGKIKFKTKENERKEKLKQNS